MSDEATTNGKGSARRPERKAGAYERGYDNIKWTKPAQLSISGVDKRKRSSVGKNKRVSIK